MLADLSVAVRVRSGKVGDAGIGVELVLSLFPDRETLSAKLTVGWYSECLAALCAQELKSLSDQPRRTALTTALKSQEWGNLRG